MLNDLACFSYRKHEIDEELGTPHRNHIKFPGVQEKKSTLAKKKVGTEETRQKQGSESLGDRKKIESKARVSTSEGVCQGKTASAALKQSRLSSALKVGGKQTASARKLSSGSSISKKAKVNDATKKETKSPIAEGVKASLGDRLYEHMFEKSEPAKLERQDTAKGLSSGLPPLDADSETRSEFDMDDCVVSFFLLAPFIRELIHAYPFKYVCE